MSMHFYLSYAPADYSEHLREFCEDLTCTIRARLLQSGNEPVGFLDRRGIARDSHWPADVAEALRTSQTMVVLMSPEYFRTASSGKEWQIFEMRRRLRAEPGSNEVSGVIAPVIWIPREGNVPKVVSDCEDSLGQVNGVYRQNGLLMMRESLTRFGDEYVNILVTLAEQIIAMARIARLPPLDDLPPFDEVDDAFNSPYELSISFTDQARDGRYKAIVVERHEQVRKMLVEYLRFSDFEVDGYEEARLVPARILKNEPQGSPPDLFVVDLECEADSREGLGLIESTKAIKTRPAVMALTAGLSDKNLIEAMQMGAEDVVPKPFDVPEIVERMKNLASIGRNRRLRPSGQFPSDSTDDTRIKRPVFLSYSSKDNKNKGVATFLRSNIEARGIGVYYADDHPLPEGSAAAKSILKAIDEAQVYLPLLTYGYPTSCFCLAELVRFYSRLATDDSRTLLPVLHDSPKTMPHFAWIKPIIEEHQYADLTSGRFLNGLIALLGWIQRAVGNGTTSPGKSLRTRKKF
jgi:DNA-binding response OmpR family regulator